MAINTTKKENIYFIINCLVIFIIGFGTFIYSIHPDFSDFRNSIYGLIVNFLVLAGIILYVTLSRKISMPLLGKITVWVYGLLFLLSGIFDFGRIEMLFFFIYFRKDNINVFDKVFFFKSSMGWSSCFMIKC